MGCMFNYQVTTLQGRLNFHTTNNDWQDHTNIKFLRTRKTKMNFFDCARKQHRLAAVSFRCFCCFEKKNKLPTATVTGRGCVSLTSFTISDYLYKYKNKKKKPKKIVPLFGNCVIPILLRMRERGGERSDYFFF